MHKILILNNFFNITFLPNIYSSFEEVFFHPGFQCQVEERTVLGPGDIDLKPESTTQLFNALKR